MNDFITSAKITDFSTNPVEINEIKYDDGFRVFIEYTVGTDSLKETTDGQDIWHGTLTYELPAAIKVKAAKNGDVKNGSDVVGSYEIDTNGNVTIKLDEDKFAEGTQVNGTLNFEAALSSEEYYKDGSVQIDWIGDGSKVSTLEVLTKKSLNISKTGTFGSYDKDTNIITFDYVVEIEAPTGTDNTIDLVDEVSAPWMQWGYGSMPTATKLTRKNLLVEKISVDANGVETVTVVDGQSWKVENLQAGWESERTDSLELPALAKGEKYRISYSVEEKAYTYANWGAYGEYKQNNTATATTIAKYDPENPVLAEASSNPGKFIQSDNYTDISIDKSSTPATADSKNNTITWHYSVEVESKYGTNNQEISFTDTLKNAAYGTARTATNIKVTKGDAKQEVNNHSLTAKTGDLTKEGAIAIEGTLPALGKNEYYTITYDVLETGLNSKQSPIWPQAHNEAKITTKDYPDGKTDEEKRTVEFVGSDYSDLSIVKDSITAISDTENNTITWHYKVTVSSVYGSKEDIVFTDTLQNDGVGTTRKATNIVVKKGETSVTAVWDTIGTEGSDKAGFIVLKGTLSKLEADEKYIIEYDVLEEGIPAEMSDWVTQKNIAEVKTDDLTKTDDAEFGVQFTGKSFTDIGVDKNAVKATADTTAGTITWEYEVKVYSEYGTGDQVINFKDQLTTEATGTAREVKELAVTKGDAKDSVSGHSLVPKTGDLTAAGAVAIEGTLPALNAKEYYTITYKVIESGILSSTAGNVSAKNTAYVSIGTQPEKSDNVDSGVEYIGEDVTPDLQKNGWTDGSNKKVNWSVTVNSQKYASLLDYKLEDVLEENGVSKSVEIVSTVKNESADNYQEFKDVKLPVSIAADKEDPAKVIMTDADGNTFVLLSEKDKLTFEYSTDIDPELLTVTYKNTVTLKKEGETDISTEKEVSVQQASLKKTATGISKKDAEGYVNIGWSATIMLPDDGIKVGDRYKDEIKQINYKNQEVSNINGKNTHSMTQEQLLNLTVSGVDKSAWTFENIKFWNAENTTVDWGTGYTGDTSTWPTGCRIAAFEIKFIQPVAKSDSLKSITINYESSGYVGDFQIGESTRYSNWAAWNNEYVSDSIEYVTVGSGDMVSKTMLDDAGVHLYNKQEGKPEGTRLYYKVVINESLAAEGPITFTDTFPANTTLVTDNWSYGGINYNYNPYWYTSSYGGVSFTFENTSQTGEVNEWRSANNKNAKDNGIVVFSTKDSLTIQFPEIVHYNASNNVRAKTIFYYALDYKVPDGTTAEFPVTVTNNASVTYEGETSSSSASTTIVQKGFVDKTAGSYDEASYTLPFSVEIKTLSDSTADETMTVKDTMTYAPYHQLKKGNRITSVSILPGTAKLYAAGTGGAREDVTEGSAITFTDNNSNGTCEITAKVPCDGRTYYLEYTYLFEYETTRTFDVEISNKVTVVGKSEDLWSDSIKTKYSHDFSGATATTDNTKLSLVKIEKDNGANVLQGAIYNLEKWDGTHWIDLGNFKTNEQGTVDLGELSANGTVPFIRYNYVYRLKEVKAPEGYKAQEGYTYIYLDGNQTHAPKVPEDFDTYEIAKVINRSYIYIEDEKTEVGKIDVEKLWKDAEGNNLTENLPESITVNLWQSTSETKNTADITGTPFKTAILSATGNWKASFENLPLEKDGGNVYYFVTESTDEAEYEVSYAPAGGMVNGVFVITNTKPAVKPAEVKVQFSGTKGISGIASTDKKFTFELYEADENFAVGTTPIDSVSTIGTISEGTTQGYSFDEITYEKEGTHYYVIKEKALENADGFTANSTEYKVTVIVTDNGTGSLEAKISGLNANGSGANFTNVYKKVFGSLTVTKSFEGTCPLSADEKNAISFTVEGPNAYKNTFTYGDMENGVKTLSNLELGKYTVKESNAGKAGYTLTTVYKVGETATAEVALSETEANAAIEVTNSYTRETGSLKITKAFSGISASDLTEAQKKEIKFSITGPESYSKEVTFDQFTDGTYTIADLPTGEYIVTETASYMPATHMLSVTYGVTDGKVEVVKGATAEVTVTNSYTEKGAASLTLKGTKTLDGKAPAAGKFSFKVENATEDALAAAVTLPTNATNDAEGNFTFGAISFAKPGTYTLKVSEVKGEDNTVIYDKTEYTVEVTVAAYENSSVYEVTEVSVNGTAVSKTNGIYGLTSKEATFSNTTKTGSLKLEKIVNGLTTDVKSSYNFELTDANGKYYNANGTTNPSGYAVITLVPGYTYTIPNLPLGKYTLREIDGAVTGYNVTTVYVVDGVKTQSIEFTGTDTEANVEVTNTYAEKGAASLILKGTKTLDGKAPAAGKFSFKVENATEDTLAAAVTLPANATNDEAGNFTFGAIRFAKPGTYTLKVSEVNGEDNTVIYDTTVYTVEVTVAARENASGYEVTMVVVNNEDVASGTDGAYALTSTNEKATFNNKVSSVKVSKIDITSETELEGATLQILDSKGEVVEEWVSTKEAHEVTGLKTGETYTLREIVAPDGYTVTTDTTFSIDASGNVTSSGTITKDGVLLVEDAKTSIKVSKVDITSEAELAGATLQILDSKGEVVETWVSTTEPHEIRGLKTGETYTLREIVAPDGYTIATDTTFVLNEKGEVDKSKTTTHVKDGVLLVEDAKTSIKVSKVDIVDGKEREGATLQILNSEGKVVEEWTSTKEAHEVTGLKTGETYTLRETVAPDGYTVTTDTIFSIDAIGNVTSSGTISEKGVLLVEDTKTKVKVSKVDIADGKELEGATIQILDSKGNVVEEWTSTTEVHEIVGLKTGEEYTLKEIIAPEGYTIATDTKFAIHEDGTVVTTGSMTKDGVLLVEDAKTSIKVSKVDITSEAELAGATLQILDSTGEVVETWVSTTEPHEIRGLKTGETYTLKETVAPDGYTVTTDTTFSIDASGNVTSSGSMTKDGVLLVEDAMTSVKVSKVDIADGEELEGATLQILDSKGEVVETWISTTEPYEIRGLKTGETYTLRETVAPDGYTITTDTTFALNEKGEVDKAKTTTHIKDGVLLVEDTKTKVKVSKVDIADGEEVAGAHIQILDKEGNVVEEWDSTTEAHEIEGLKTGEEYTLRETVAPDGYTVTSDTTFSIDETGKVTSSGTISEEGVLLVEDTKTLVKVSKVDVANGKEVEGAHIQILDKDGKVVDEWVSTEEIHEIEGLKTGEEYTLREVVAPDGYTVATDTKFVIRENGNVETTGSMTEDGVLLVEDEMTSIKVSKVDIADGEEVAGATIQILDKDGNVVEEWTSTTEAHEIKGLKTGEEYTLRETVAPDGYTVTSDTTFSIDETGKVTSSGTISEEGVLLVEDEKTSIKVSKVDIADGKELEGAIIQIIDKDGKVVEEWTSTTEAHEIKGLKTGEEYTLRETVAPHGYNVATDTTFVIDETGKVTSTGTITEDGVLLVEDAIGIGSISVTKRVTLNGKGIKLDKTFYVALFTDEAGTARYSDVKALEIKEKSKDGTATVTFENLPYGTYYVHEVEEDGSLFSGEDRGVEVVATVKNGEITLTEANKTASATITNDYQATPPEGYTTLEPEEEESEAATEEEEEKSAEDAVKTGDTTNFMIYIIMMLAAAGCAGGALFDKKKRVR